MLNLIRIGYAIVLTGIALLFAFFIQQGNWLETDLRTLLPQEARWQAVQIEADQRLEKQLNQQMVALIGNQDAAQAFESSENVAQLWRQSGVFSSVKSKTQPDLTALAAEVQALKLATLPPAVRIQLLEQPREYFQQYAEQLVNPFSHTNLLTLEQDWLGFGRFVLAQAQQLSNMQWNAENGFIYTQQNGKTWVLINAQLKQADLLNGQQHLLDIVAQSRTLTAQANSEILIASTALFAATAKLQAESESTIMSVLGIGLTLLLLLGVFRRIRVLWLFLPIMAGMLAGVTLTIAILGKVHILTLVIGTSLIGVLIDFPLHWLASSLTTLQWQPEKSMRQHRSTFLLTLSITLLGYGLLWFTSLPILKQTALFSAVALVIAILCTLLFLPYLFKNTQYNSVALYSLPIRFWQKKVPSWWLAPILIFVVLGVYRSQWQDNIRQWVAIPTEMLVEAKQISELTGIDLGNQYFLITAENDDELLHKTENLSARLTALSQPHQALSQWIMSETAQREFSHAMAAIQSQDYAIVEEVGIPNEYIAQTLNVLSHTPTLSLQQALHSQLGQGWQRFYLGEIAQGKYATIVKIVRPQQTTRLQALANNQDIFWQDKTAYLNAAFEQTRNQAAWLKVASFLLAGLLLWRLFDMKSAVKILAIPFIAIIVTVAVFGWFGLPITLFTMFGLLLVSAIGIDYTAYMHSVQESIQTKRIAIMLAALTTMISFGLLALSATPAVASFGLSVTVGVFVTMLLTCKNG